MSTHSIIDNISIDRLYTIERERENTIADPGFQQWCKDMKIGYRVQKREGIDNANALMAQWNNEIQSGLPEWIRRMY
jgi:hypothetical protein